MAVFKCAFTYYVKILRQMDGLKPSTITESLLP